MMTVMNKYVLSGLDFNLNFFLLLVQVCVQILHFLGQGVTGANLFWVAVCGLHRCYSVLQNGWCHYIP
jgi:hypothetical protein